jgi:hypothetical protein
MELVPHRGRRGGQVFMRDDAADARIVDQAMASSTSRILLLHRACASVGGIVNLADIIDSMRTKAMS